METIFEQIEKNIDNLVTNNADWTASATREELDAARLSIRCPGALRILMIPIGSSMVTPWKNILATL
jgi:hypothetical protein